MLVGRSAECGRIDALLTAASSGTSNSLVILGEPGVGKSELLRYAMSRAEGMRILTACGIESESEIAFSGLADLLRPILNRLHHVPAPQAASLSASLALGPPAESDRFATFAGALTLLAAASEESPLLVALDDAHWLDVVSSEALVFVARRLAAEGILFLAAVRSGESSPFLSAGLSELKLEGLDLEASKAVLSATGRHVSEAVAKQLFAATRGNPLALVEVPTLLSDKQLAGKVPLEQPVRAGAGIEQAFRRRLERLPIASQQALLVAAASDLGDMEQIARACGQQGLGMSALEDAESAGLIAASQGRVEWFHPLLRSAVYHSATPGARRRAHLALAETPSESSDRRAWHLAAAAIGPDRGVAAALEAVALDARQRNGHEAAARAFARAAGLTPEGDERARRLHEAARDAQLAGSTEYAIALCDEALVHVRDSILKSDISMVRALTQMWAVDAPTAIRTLETEATKIEPIDPKRAALMLAEAAIGFSMRGDVPAVLELAERCQSIASNNAYADVEAAAEAAYCNGLVLAGEAKKAGPVLARYRRELEGGALNAVASPALVQAVIHTAVWMEEYDDAALLLHRVIDQLRAIDAVGLLPFPLGILSELDFRTGRWNAAIAAAAESMQLAVDTNQPNLLGFSLVCLAAVEAAQGRDKDCCAHVDQAGDLASRVGAESVLVYATAALGLLALGKGDHENAIHHLEKVDALTRADHLGEPGVVLWGADRVEAYVGAGRHSDAKSALESFQAQGEHTQRNWALAAAARCRGMVAGGPDFESHFQQSLQLHRRVLMPFETARTELRFAESLLRRRHAADAAKLLRQALSTFESLGAQPWAETARRDLRSAGAVIPAVRPSATAGLTHHELQVALMIARGASNKEAAAALFLSTKTIEFHLSNIYRKLKLPSRTALASLLARDLSTPVQTMTSELPRSE